MAKEESSQQKELAAKQALAERNYAYAVELFSELYSQKPTSRQNYLLVQALSGLGDFENALAVAQESLASYLAEDERLILYIHVAVCAGQGLSIKELLEGLRKYMSDAEKQMLFHTLDQEYADYSLLKKDELNQLKKQIRYLGGYSPLKQRALAKQAQKLSSCEFVSAVRTALVDSNVHPLVRASFLNDLRLLKVTERFDYWTFFGQKIQIDPNKLQAVDETAVYQHLQKLVLKKYEYSANLIQKMMDEISLKLMIIYPVFSEIERQPKIWLSVLLNDAQLATCPASYQKIANQLEKSISEWQPAQK